MSLAERKRQLVRNELTEAALKLLGVQGFEETTIDQMAAAAGVSRRTFFRYFRSKEDVITESLCDHGRRLSQILSARPTTEPPAVALHNTLRAFTDTFWEHPEKSQRLAKATMSTPALRARYLERQFSWRAMLTAELAARMGTDPSADLRPAVLVGVAFAAFDTALMRWVEQDSATDLNALLSECFAVAFP
ncbi:TetR family transcriptional regulator [Dactylosporangium sp. NPDC050688]|uniref:TetR family transcriptional regulator n=1 Tax=Dactylosporangium sp. NPDC050688 TaxID=3157217 RepID=UPI0033F4AC0B